MKTTLVIDSSVFAHQLHAVIGDHINSPHFEGIIRAQLIWLQSGEWLGSIKPGTFQTVLAYDYKPYWRTDYLKNSKVVSQIPQKTKAKTAKAEKLQALLSLPKESVLLEQAMEIQDLTDDLAVHYKGGRKFPESSFTKLKKVLSRTAIKMNWHQLGMQFFEADDVAASISRANRALPENEQHNLILVTVDTDWLGLLDKRTRWFCMHGWFPRVRSLDGSFNFWSNKRLKAQFDVPSDIWKFKSENGDKSDNLPAGSPLEVIDLLNPPEGFRVWDYPLFQQQVDSILSGEYSPINVSKMVDGAKKYLQTLGVPLAIRTYDASIDSIIFG